MKKFILPLIALLLICICFVGCENVPHEPVIREYRVISVQTYIKVTSTNGFGAIQGQDLRYHFTYIDDQGSLHQFKDFHHTEYGYCKLCVGTENKYVVKGDYHYLYLTEEMFDRLSN